MKQIALGACLLAAGSVLAQNQTYRVREGDTISGIAKRHGVSQKAIQQANGLKNQHRLKLGSKLFIPGLSSAPSHQTTRAAGGYSVRPGDTDVRIAKRFQLTGEELRGLNPGVRWATLQIGQSIRVSRKSATKAASAQARSAGASTGGYTILAGDNDWIIAKRLGTTPKVLRKLNPGLKWTSIQPGNKINVPGKAAAKVASAPKIRSRYAKVVGYDVSLRREPNTHGKLLAVVDGGTQVMVLDHENGWYKLRFPKGTEGWVRGDFLKPINAAQIAKAKKAKPAVSTTIVTKNSQKKKAPPVKRTLVALRESNSSGNALLDKANSFRGVQYRYGAMSRSATDCSGFTSQVFKSQGIKLPRTAAQQALTGSAVARGALKAGDLVFFRTTRGRRISHVGIFIGNGKFIHASSGGGQVMISGLNEGYYNKRFASARRIAKFRSDEAMDEMKKLDPIMDNVTQSPRPDPKMPIAPQIGTDEIIR